MPTWCVDQITLAGFALIMVPHILLLCLYGFTLNTPVVPFWLSIMFGVFLLIYMVG